MQVKQLLNAFGLKCKKHSPEILMGIGIGAMVTGGVMACRTTYKKTSVRRLNYDIKLAEIEDEVNDGKKEEETAVAEIKKETREYRLDLVKYYVVPVTVEAAGIACILASNHIMRKRIAGLTVAFTTVNTAFEKYRERVRERYGDEVDRSILLGEKQVTIETTDEKGKTKKETITVADPDISSIGRYFTRRNGNWSESEAFLNNFFSMQSSYLTDLLRARGFVLLNDIYDALGFEKDTEAGIVVGKVYDRDSDDNRITITWKKVTLPDEFGNYEDAWYIDFPGLEIIYGLGAGHRSIAT